MFTSLSYGFYAIVEKMKFCIGLYKLQPTNGNNLKNGVINAERRHYIPFLISTLVVRGHSCTLVAINLRCSAESLGETRNIDKMTKKI